MFYDTFMDWFGGRWNNSRQVHNNPRGNTHINVKHQLVSERVFSCTYTIHRQRHPYRNVDCEVFHNDGVIVLRNPVMDLNFRLEHGVYVSRERKKVDGILYVSESYLSQQYYNVIDQGFDIKSGRQLWGLPDGEFYAFDRNSSTTVS